MEKYKNKLKFRSWHRGTKEADLLLGRFIDKYNNIMSHEDLLSYEKFLNELRDNDILQIIKGEKPWPANLPKRITKLLDEFLNSETF